MQTNKILLSKQFVKYIIEKFVARVVLLKESMIILGRAKCDFIEQNN